MPEYIEREAAIAAIMSEPPDAHYPHWYADKIKKIQAANVATVRHGRWIEYTKVVIPEPYNKWEQAWKCSECGFDDGFVAYNFCPNCGARMDLEVTDNG